ncbi:hypothetical protein ACYPKM_01450 [Pseudomonas aeruginosa]
MTNPTPLNTFMEELGAVPDEGNPPAFKRKLLDHKLFTLNQAAPICDRQAKVLGLIMAVILVLTGGVAIIFPEFAALPFLAVAVGVFVIFALFLEAQHVNDKTVNAFADKYAGLIYEKLAFVFDDVEIYPSKLLPIVESKITHRELLGEVFGRWTHQSRLGRPAAIRRFTTCTPKGNWFETLVIVDTDQVEIITTCPNFRDLAKARITRELLATGRRTIGRGIEKVISGC